MPRILVIAILLIFSLPALAARNILIFGDSLSAGYGIPLESAWPSLLQKELQTARSDYNVVNLSISGETTAGGRARLPQALQQHNPAIVVLALGANDGLRGLPLKEMQGNLEAMVAYARQSGSRIILVGMRLPPNYGPYADKFSKVYGSLAKKLRLPLVPFLLEGVADKQRLFQADGLHPIAMAQRRIMDNVWPALKKEMQ